MSGTTLMPVYLTGKLRGPEDVLWFQAVSPESSDQSMVLTVPADLFSKLPGIRMAGAGWVVDVAKLGLPRNSIAGAHWLPRTGTFAATVEPSDSGGYVLTVQF